MTAMDLLEICFLFDYLRVPGLDALRPRQLEVRLNDPVGQRPDGENSFVRKDAP